MTDKANFDTEFDSDTSPAIQTAFPKVVATVVGTNGREAALRALAGLERTRYPHLELALVDDGSMGDAAAVAEIIPQVQVVGCRAGAGTVERINAGIRHAVADGCDYLLLLDDDIETDPAMLAELVDVAEAEPMVCSVGPKIRHLDDRERLRSVGGLIRLCDVMATDRGRGWGEVDRGQYDRIEDVDYFHGRAALIRRSALERVGLFDVLYDAGRLSVGAESADWCLRATRLGYRCRYAPRAIAWQPVADTDGGAHARDYARGRGAVILARRYASGREWVRFWLTSAATLPVAYVRRVASGNEEAARALWLGMRDGFDVELSPPEALR